MKSLKIVLLFDLSMNMTASDCAAYWNEPDWKPEKDIKTALMNLGHHVIPFGIYDDITGLIDLIQKQKVDLVFNMSEAFLNKRELQPQLIALLELLNIPFTGAHSECLQICKSKGLTKMILNHHHILTPQFEIVKKNMAKPTLKDFRFPGFVKPLDLEASEGISLSSYVQNEKEALARIEFIHNNLNADAILEEFIDGREMYVGVIGNEQVTAFAPRELFFKDMDERTPKFATYRSKWDQKYRKKWGIDSGWAKDLSEFTEKKLLDVSKKIYRLLQIQGYGRIDFRVKNNQIYFIEANPNPSIAKKEDFALSAAKSGINYDQLIEKIVKLALSAAESKNKSKPGKKAA